MMKAINKYMKASGLFCAALALGACSDEWDDHYDVAGGVPGSNVTLWETMNANSQLSNFTKVLEACGYKPSLAGNQVFTVFAPTNDNLTTEDADGIISLYNQEKAAGVINKDNKAIKEFVQNHIALYNHSVAKTGADTTIVMMNGKYQTLGPAAFAGQSLLTKNQLIKNGVLFTMGSPAEYLPNVFEYLEKDDALDSIASFLYSYNNYEFDPDQSVPGEIVDGETTYLDSVKVLKNDVLRRYIGEVNEEDSVFWMLAPNNEQWKAMIDQYSSFYNYDNTVVNRDSLSNLWAHLAVSMGTVFSMSNNTESSLRDSAYSVNAIPASARELDYGFKDARPYIYDRPFDAGGVFENAEMIKCSNGYVLKVPNWNLTPDMTFLRRIKVEAENTSYRKEYAETASRIPTIVTVSPDNKEFYNKISGNKYLELLSVSKDSKPSVTFNISNVLSSVPYDIKLVMAPALAGDTLATDEQRKLLLVTTTLGWNKQDGSETTKQLQRRMEVQKDVVDTLLLAEDFVFETCSYDLDTPQVTLKIESSGRPSGSKKDQYQTSLRIDCIILEPKFAK